MLKLQSDEKPLQDKENLAQGRQKDYALREVLIRCLEQSCGQFREWAFGKDTVQAKIFDHVASRPNIDVYLSRELGHLKKGNDIAREASLLQKKLESFQHHNESPIDLELEIRRAGNGYHEAIIKLIPVLNVRGNTEK